MVGQPKRNDESDVMDDELSCWPSSVREEGGWVRFTDEQPSKPLPARERDVSGEAVRRSDDDWFLGAYRRYHADGKVKSAEETRESPPVAQVAPQRPAPPPVVQRPPAPPKDKLQPIPNFDEIDLLLPYEEQPTVAMFTRRPQRSLPRRVNSTREELYREAKRLGIEGRSKMNKHQLALALGDTPQEP